MKNYGLPLISKRSNKSCHLTQTFEVKILHEGPWFITNQCMATKYCGPKGKNTWWSLLPRTLRKTKIMSYLVSLKYFFIGHIAKEAFPSNKSKNMPCSSTYVTKSNSLGNSSSRGKCSQLNSVFCPLSFWYTKILMPFNVMLNIKHF